MVWARVVSAERVWRASGGSAVLDGVFTRGCIFGYCGLEVVFYASRMST